MGFTMKAARALRNLTQEQTAEKMGISRGYYGKMENGEIEMKPYHVYAFCCVTGISVDDFIMPTKFTDSEQ